MTVTLHPREKTLTDAEIDAVAAKIVASVEKQTGGALPDYGYRCSWQPVLQVGWILRLVGLLLPDCRLPMCVFVLTMEVRGMESGCESSCGAGH